MAHTRHNKASDSLEKDIKNKQSAAEHLWSEMMRAEEAGKKDMAAKLRRDYQEKKSQISKLQSETRRPLSGKSRSVFNEHFLQLF